MARLQCDAEKLCPQQRTFLLHFQHLRGWQTGDARCRNLLCRLQRKKRSCFQQCMWMRGEKSRSGYSL